MDFGIGRLGNFGIAFFNFPISQFQNFKIKLSFLSAYTNMDSPSSIANPEASTVILKAGLLAGTLDILAACTQYYLMTGNNPVRVLKYVASGAFGTTALSGGTAAAVWGLVFHYMFAFGFTLLFFFIYPRLSILSKNKWVTAIVYGLFVWMVMNLLIVPNSQVPKSPFVLSKALVAAAILICMISTPISFMIREYYANKNKG